MSIKFNKLFVRFLEDKVEGYDGEIVASPMLRGEDYIEPAAVGIYTNKSTLIITLSSLQNENVAIESGNNVLERNKRFLNYWLTITKVIQFSCPDSDSSFFSCISDNHLDFIHHHLLNRITHLHTLWLQAWRLRQ